ncbi:MAG: hypothetical protein QG610_2202 [Euryarchaeota archaeon]|nr:hypothetical protein [Euryarchaeota archaeon]
MYKIEENIFIINNNGVIKYSDVYFILGIYSVQLLWS